MNKEQLQQEYIDGRRDFTNLDLSDLDLTKINLEGADLTGSNLKDSILISARLEGANLTNVILEKTNLKYTNLLGANLTNVNLENTNLEHTNLRKANLVRVNLSQNNIYRTYLDESNLKQANFKGSTLNDVCLKKANLEEVNLEEAIFLHSRLNEVNLTSANLKQANLTGGYLNQAILRNADLTGANLTKANLENADLTGATLTDSKVDGVYWRGCKLDDFSILPQKEAIVWQIHNTEAQNLELSRKNLSKVNLREANLVGTNLTGTDLSGADLEDANLTDANLTGVNLSGACLWRANLTNANLTGANLSKTHLGGTDFTNANLTNANLTNIEFEDTNFRGANLQGIQFEGTSFISCNLFEAKNYPSPVFSPLFIPANHPDADLVNSIRSVTEGLDCGSEYNYPYDIFLWNRIIRGEFKLEQLLKEMGHLNSINLQDLQPVNSNAELVNKFYQILLDKIQGKLFEIEIYQFETKEIKDEPENAYIIIGRTIVGDWFSAMLLDSEIDNYRGISDYFDRDITQQMIEALAEGDKAMEKTEHINLISTLEEAGTEMEKILPDSRNKWTDYLIWSLAEERDLALHQILFSTDMLTIGEIEDCNHVTQANYSYREEKKLEQQQREAFAQLVFNNLSNIRLYVFGECDIDFYLIGETANQDWLGIYTRVVWT